MRESHPKQIDFSTLFRQATDGLEPLPYQQRLALHANGSSLLNVPTGLGKTAAAILGWVWRRRFADESTRRETPRRLVYCLPMRVLAEQTYRETVRWLKQLNLQSPDHNNGTRPSSTIGSDEGREQRPKLISVHLLMGGEEQTDWALWPEQDAILIGTQDMLLSAALNRGYGISRFRWPLHFAFLNNDCLWVFDELQLMDVGVATTAQLEAFRRSMATSVSTQCLWMSATLDPEWLNTIDFSLDWLGRPNGLTEADFRNELVRRRIEAPKALGRAEATIGETKAIADAVAAAHVPGTRTLAIFNTVRRAVETYRELKKQKPSATVLLLHSRFRPLDREQKMQELLKEPSEEGVIAITTQVVEAGVDISAKILFTELAPWSSLVQRFGRCNRAGEFLDDDPGRVFWLDLPQDERQQLKLTNPYSLEELIDARDKLHNCLDVSPAALGRFDARMELEASHVIRRRDFIDLFDTTPDLAGNDIDISRFIRSGTEFDVQVFWRDWKRPKDDEPPPQNKSWRRIDRTELCSAPIGDFDKFAFDTKRKALIWYWDPLEGLWRRPEKGMVHPGQTYVIHADAGGYNEDQGWLGTESRSRVEPVFSSNRAVLVDDSYDSDAVSESSKWQTVADHTNDVARELDRIISALPLADDLRRRLETAARWHDWGKAHPSFLAKFKPEYLKHAPFSLGEYAQYPAKGPNEAWRSWPELLKLSRHSSSEIRPHFRHELASALGMLALKMDDLAIYVVAAHHGKVRLSLRSLPGERPPCGEASQLFARGVWEGDKLPETDLGDDVKAPSITLSLECMLLGRSESGDPSWAERMIKLRDKYGPFQLAFFEALLRAADMRASRRAATENADELEVNV